MTRAELAIKTVEETRKTLPPVYDVTIRELAAIHDKNLNDKFGFACDMFAFGFFKGQRYAAAQQKKKRARV